MDQQTQTHQGLFAKAYEYNTYYDADVYVALQSQDNGHIFSFIFSTGGHPRCDS